MTRRYYSSRVNQKSLTTIQLCQKLQSLYRLYLEKDFFKEKAELSRSSRLPSAIKHEAALALDFQPFPIDDWSSDKISADHIFDTIEFLYDYVSKPGEWVDKETETGFRYSDYDSYNTADGQKEFRDTANLFLKNYEDGFVLNEDGEIVALGTRGMQYILDADIIPYDKANVDDKVQEALVKWRDRHSTPSEKREAVRTLADVFEWLKKTKKLSSVLNAKDDSALFDIANNFAIRHHNPKQKNNYDEAIWHSWMFHFYLATYHAVIRLLAKKDGTKNNDQ